MRVIVSLMIALTNAVPQQGLAQAALPDSIQRRADSTIAAFMSVHHVPGFSVAVGLDRRVVWSRGYGLADIENSVPVTTSSVFRTASIGKPMTATAVMQLWQDGRVDLDAPVQKYCPAFPTKRWPVTSRQLLAHLSGIRDKTAAEETNYRHFESIAAALRVFANDTLETQPGTTYRYTSYGYNVLGCVIEGASGLSYVDYMKTRIFGAAGMTHTRVDDPRVIIPYRVAGYALDDAGRLQNSIRDDMSNRIPAGGFVSTPEDLARFGLAVLDGTLVSDSARRLMFTVPNALNGAPGKDWFYALGWGTDTWNGVQEVSHGGGTPQVSAFLYMLPEKGFVVAFMMNLEGPVPDRGDLAGDLARIILGPRAPHR